MRLSLILLMAAVLSTFARPARALSSPTPSSTIYGRAAYASAGTALVTGDFNGDGLTDIAIESGEYWTQVDAFVDILWGRPSGPSPAVDLGTPISDRTAINLLTHLVGYNSSLTAGDLNSDGYDDLVIANPWYEGERSLYVVWGEATFPASTDLSAGDLALTEVRLASSYGFEFGDAVAIADVDGDGHDDLVTSAPVEPLSGKIYIVHGADTWPVTIEIPNTPIVVTTIVETQPYWRTGLSITVRDIDRDGKADVLFGSAGDAYPETTDKATLVRGANVAPGDSFSLLRHQSNATRFTSPDPGDYLGASVAMGDVDADGFVDVMLGDPYASFLPQQYCGAAFVVYGGENWDDIVSVDSGETPVTAIWGYGYDANYGWLVQCADITGDLNAEAILTGQAGGYNVAAVKGSIHMPPVIPIEALDPSNVYRSGQAGFDNFGTAMCTGDVNGDGIDDLLIGATSFDGLGRQNSGAVFVYYGERPTAVSGGGSRAPRVTARVFNFPNPFSQATSISVTRVPGGVEWIDIFDVAGRPVASLRATAESGQATAVWDGGGADGSAAPSGVYFARPRGVGRFVGGRMLLLR